MKSSYQKLKKERDIIWEELEGWIGEFATTKTKDKKEIEKFVAVEMQWIKYRIANETK